jgi:phenylacetate-CoA ligase
MTGQQAIALHADGKRSPRALAPLRVGAFVLLRLLEPILPALLVPGLERLRWRVGRWRAWRVADLAGRTVPAYRTVLAEHGEPRVLLAGLDPDLASLPVLDKASYAQRFPIEELCVGGRLPHSGVVVDESSGTSGTASNWVRGRRERAAARRSLRAALRFTFGPEPLFVLNAFALGPWATGMNVSMAVADTAILKSIGPDAGKIVKTLELFGPEHRYLVCGYPPFLKHLVDTAGLDWSRYDVVAVYGGEGISEPMRAYLGKAFRAVYGSYGASDLEINLAAETDFTVALRQRMAVDAGLRERLTGSRDGPLPLVFQYNPVDYVIESVDGELVVTICRPTNVSPRVRYNIHDSGHVLRVPELRRALAELRIDVRELGELRLDLPLLFLGGRSDEAVPFYGSKVTPADVEAALFSVPALAPLVSSFALVTWEDDALNPRLTLAVELSAGVELPAEIEPLRAALLEHLAAVNQDYREIRRIVPHGLEPSLELCAHGTGPFAGADVRLKRRYIQSR